MSGLVIIKTSGIKRDFGCQKVFCDNRSFFGFGYLLRRPDFSFDI